MKLYLVNAENIYFDQIKEYFREIVSSYDNGNYRSAMVMLYSTVVCDLLLKLKELSEVYSDEKAEKILEDINKKRKGATNSEWEHTLIDRIHRETEILTDDSYAMIEHIYSLRNFSAHPALNEDYELISPSAEMTVAYVKKALDDIFVRPSVFAQNIVDRMSNYIDAKRDIYEKDIDSFRIYLNKVYFQRMSSKMVNQVFKAFWKFVFVKKEGEIFENNRYINRKTLEIMLEKFGDIIVDYINTNSIYFSVAQDDTCLTHLCVLLAYFPKVYNCLPQETKYQIEKFDKNNINLIKWFVIGDLEQHIASFRSHSDTFPSDFIKVIKKVCKRQGQPQLFHKLLIKHYSRCNSYSSARCRFDGLLAKYIKDFSAVDFIELIEVINANDQIYGYGWQDERNDKILVYAKPLLPDGFDFDDYPNFIYTKETPDEELTTEQS